MVPVKSALEPSGQPPQPPAPKLSPDRESPGGATPDEDWRVCWTIVWKMGWFFKKKHKHMSRGGPRPLLGVRGRRRSPPASRLAATRPRAGAPQVAARRGFALAARVQPGPEAGQPIARTRAGRKPGSGLPGAPRPRRGAVPASSGVPRPGISSSSLRAARRPDRGWARVRPRPVGKRGPPPPRRPRRALGPQGLGAAGPGADSERRGPRAGGGRRRRRRKRRRRRRPGAGGEGRGVGQGRGGAGFAECGAAAGSRRAGE